MVAISKALLPVFLIVVLRAMIRRYPISDEPVCRETKNLCCYLLLGPLLISVAAAAAAGEHCLDCHASKTRGFAPGHGFAARHCVGCHQGDGAATKAQEAHRGLIPFPGQLDNAAQTCGGCHPHQVKTINHSLMYRGRGMVATTRRVLGQTGAAHGDDLSHLGEGVADSLLRKLCASCHLGQSKREHRLDVTHDRGGGCLACHIDHYPAKAHPALSARVSDGRCFGCHSRSGRISLNYVGLAEIDPDGIAVPSGRLADGRLLESRPTDVHQAAGMSCTDCHTARGLMGDGKPHSHQGDAVDIRCSDCHRNDAPRITAPQWPEPYLPLLRRVPFPRTPETRFLTTSKGTPLWNLELRTDGAYLHRKDGNGMLPIPSYTDQSHPRALQHRRLSCSACHSQWAPQCYGCHLSYDPAATQWDHSLRASTPGRWIEQRSGVRNDLPPLGVTAEDRIVPVTPGMVMRVDHPDWSETLFVRRFNPIEPHTTGPARSCTSCHRSSSTLGLGQGRLTVRGGHWRFQPHQPILQDGLPADAWTSLKNSRRAVAAGETRPFDAAEIRRILKSMGSDSTGKGFSD